MADKNPNSGGKRARGGRKGGRIARVDQTPDESQRRPSAIRSAQANAAHPMRGNFRAQYRA